MRLISYSQYYEDVILYALFGDEKKIGFYIDVGANDPVEISVTKMFYDLGWNGINIEPLDTMHKLLCIERPRDINLNIAIGNKKEILNIIKDGVYSHIITDSNKTEESDNLSECELDTLTNIYFQYGNGREVDFCKIDVEGFEKQVLEGIDFRILRPRVFVIESVERGSLMQSYKQWEYILNDNGYQCAYEYYINRFYIEKKDLILKKRFEHLPQLLANKELVKATYAHAYNFVNGLNYQQIKERIIIWGAGNYFAKFISEEWFPLLDVKYVVDNDEQKWGVRDGYCIKSPKEILNENDAYIIVICCNSQDDIVKQLQQMGVEEYLCYRP